MSELRRSSKQVARTESTPVEGAARARPFGLLLRQLRLGAGLTREQLAEKAGLSEDAVATLERGERATPRLSTLSLLADALQVDPTGRAELMQAAGYSRGGVGTGSPRHARAVLPQPPSPLIGRAAELAQANRLFQSGAGEPRLVTMVGPGGVGKTRLALEVAGQVAGHYRDGVVFVDLAPLRDARLVAVTIARALGIRDVAGRTAQELLRLELGARHLLLVLDNFEHVLGAASLVADLLTGCPELALLVTSRTALRVRAEHRFPVAALASADIGQSFAIIAAAPAVQLFVRRAQATAPTFALTDDNAADVAAVCKQLDGLPLAIELAAARASLLQPRALLARLERRLSSLTGGLADLPERQRTMRNTLAWSYDLLEPIEQRLFRRLAAFAGGWTLESVEAVCTDQELLADDVPERVRALMDSSLVYQIGREDQQRRFRMLEIVREYAELQLHESGEASSIRDRHRDWFVAWAERVQPRLTGPEQTLWYARLTDELDNLRHARDWIRHDADAGELELRLAGALGRYWWIRAPGSEGREWLGTALEHGPSARGESRAHALTWSGQLEALHGNAQESRIRLQEAVVIAQQVGDAQLVSLALRHQALYCADPRTAVSLLERAIAVARAAQDQRELALGLSYLATAREWQGDRAAARVLAQQAVQAGRAAGDPAALTEALLREANERLLARDFDAARAIMQEALDLSWRIDYRNYIGIIDRQLAWIALEEGELLQACDHLLASLDVVRNAANGAEGVRPLKLATRLLLACGRDGAAVRLLGAIEAWQLRYQFDPEGALWSRRWTLPGDEDVLGHAHVRLAEGELAAARADGSRLSLDEALAEAVDDVRNARSVLAADTPRVAQD